MIIKKITRVEYAHLLSEYNGACRNVHGHSGKVTFMIEGEIIKGGSEGGMVMDFSILKDMIRVAVVKQVDHALVLSEADEDLINFMTRKGFKLLVLKDPPTAEVLAKWAYDKLNKYLNGRMRILSVEWTETENNSAIYQP